VVEKPADAPRREIASEGPGGIGIAKAQEEVRNSAQHHALVDIAIRQVDGVAVDGKVDAARQLHVEAGRGNHDVGLERPAG